MRNWVTGWASCLLLGLMSACGGVVEGGHSSKNDGSDPSDSASEQTKAADDPVDQAELGDCVLGPKEDWSSDAPCPWVADERCYQERAAACNCACPRDRDSQCVSGFPGTHTPVSCH